MREIQGKFKFENFREGIFLLQILLGSTMLYFQVMRIEQDLEFLELSKALAIGFLIFIFFRYLESLFKVKAEVPRNIFKEEVLVYGQARRVEGRHGQGGTLILTKKNLIFIPHYFKKLNKTLTFPLPEIKNIKTYQMWGRIPLGFKVYTDENSIVNFFVPELDQWMMALEEIRPRGLDSLSA